MQTTLIGVEAGAGAHFLGRVLQKQGHDIRLIAARFVKPLKRERTHGLNFVHLFEIDPSIK